MIAKDWKLRTAVQADLWVIGIDALEMGSVENVERALASGHLPAVVVLEAASEFAGERAIQKVVGRVPTILIASRTDIVLLPQVAGVFYHPVSVAEIVAKVSELIERGQNA